MLLKSRPLVMLVSSDLVLTGYVQSVLESLGVCVELVENGEATVALAGSMRAPGTILLDARLPSVRSGALLAALHESGAPKNWSIGLIGDDAGVASADELFEEQGTAGYARTWVDRLNEGFVDDIVSRTANAADWATHLTTMRRTHALKGELEHLREASLRQTQHDRLTGILNRDGMLSILFRETDRVQRMGGSLCLALVDLDDFGHWNAELGLEVCDELLQMVAIRIGGLLRSYDLLGRVGKDEFLLALPGCSTVDAVMLAERLQMDIFGKPFDVDGTKVQLSACFGITTSRGRSPVVVLREAEQALGVAKQCGPGSLRCRGESPFSLEGVLSGGEVVAGLEALG